MFTVTKQWLDDHKTDAGAYTSGQIGALGFAAWPPPKGWKKMAIGMQISYEQKRFFEDRSKQKPSKSKIELLESRVLNLEKLCLSLEKEIERLKN